MRRLGVLAVLLGVQATAWGQTRTRAAPYRPPVSPYINLLRQNQNPALLYQGVIRPQIDQNRFQQQQRLAVERLGNELTRQQRESLDQFQRQQKRMDDLQQEVLLGVRPETGHPTSFLNRGGYFPGLSTNRRR